MKCMEVSKENWDCKGVNVNFRALEKSIWVLENSWKSRGNSFVKGHCIKEFHLQSVMAMLHNITQLVD